MASKWTTETGIALVTGLSRKPPVFFLLWKQSYMATTLGEKMIGIEFSTEHLHVDSILERFAKMINTLDKMPGSQEDISAAQTHIQQAAEIIKALK